MKDDDGFEIGAGARLLERIAAADAVADRDFFREIDEARLVRFVAEHVERLGAA